MTSDFGQRLHEKRLDLTVQLIRKLLDVKPDDENHELALDFCLQKEYYHTFADVSPTTVESFYISVVKRLHEDSQLSKASALSALTTKFLSYNLSTASADANHNLLQLLASLAGQPLHSVLDETPQLLAAVYQSAQGEKQLGEQHQKAVVQRFKHLVAGNSRSALSSCGSDASGRSSPAESDYDPYSEDSDLTSWDSDIEDDSSRAWQLPASAAAQARAAGIAETALQQIQQTTAEPPVSECAAVSERAAAYHLPASAVQGPHELLPGITLPQPAAVLARLATSQFDQLPLMRPDSQLCFTEPYLAKQLLRLLQGQQAHGFTLSADRGRPWEHAGAAAEVIGPGGGAAALLQQYFVPDPHVTTPSMSPSALQALLRKFATAGSAAWQLKLLARQLCLRRGVGWSAGSSEQYTPSHALLGAGNCDADGWAGANPCVRALGVALRQHLDVIGQQLAQLQQHGPLQASVTASAAAAAAAAAAVDMSAGKQQQEWSLAMVQQQTRPVLHRLLLLHRTVFGVLQQLGSTSAGVSAALLNGLYDYAHAAAAVCSGMQQAADAAALMHLLLCSCVPMVSALEQWLWSAADGRASDRCSETPSTKLHSGRPQQQQQQQQSSDHDASVCCDDFFISRKADVAATDARFWNTAYGFSKPCCVQASSSMGQATDSNSQQAEVTDELIACPSFLVPLASSILTAGKSVRLLEYMEQEESKQITWLATRAQTAPVGGAHVVQQYNISSMQRASRPSSSSGRPVRLSSMGDGSTRRRWGEDAASDAATRVGCSAAAAAAAPDLARQVRLQLAMATVVAGQQNQPQLAFEFIATANKMLRSSHAVLQQQAGWQGHLSAADASVASQQHLTSDTVTEVMSRTLQAAAAQLAKPCRRPTELDNGAEAVLQAQQPTLGLRQALLQAKALRTAKSAAQGPHQQQQQASQLRLELSRVSQEQQRQDANQPSSSCTGAQCTDNDADNAGLETAGVGYRLPVSRTAKQTPGQQQPMAASDGAIPGLLQWQHQLEARLSVVGGCLQQLAPWQQQQQQQHPSVQECTRPAGSGKAYTAVSLPSSSLGLFSSSRVPGSFSGSLADLWPLKTSAAAATAQQQQGPGQHQQVGPDVVWRAGGAWPCEQLSWLLVEPPQQMMPISQLMDQALLQPVLARVDHVGRQLLSSLMGEWGLLQQLQGLMGVFLLASPAMVEWTERCFAAVEAAKPSTRTATANRHSSVFDTDGLYSPGSVEAAVASAGVVVASAGHWAVGVEDLDVVELELQLQDLCASSEPDDPLPDPSCLHLSINTAALADIRAKKQLLLPQTQQQQTTKDSNIATARAGASATAGLWCCAAEWVGLSCRHSGTWQLSLVYDTAELDKFGQAWRFLMQLRWVRRRLDAARHAACKGAASVRKAAEQDAAELAAVIEAQQPADSVNLKYSTGVASKSLAWLSTREELLLLQEMGQLMSRWQQHIMDRLVKGAWSRLEQAVCQASSLDEVRTAAAAFLRRIGNLFTNQSSIGWKAVHRALMNMMDIALGASAAAAHLTELRQRLAKFEASNAAVQKAWVDLGAARTRLHSAQADWEQQCDMFMRLLNACSRASDKDAEVALAALDVSGYYKRRAKVLEA